MQENDYGTKYELGNAQMFVIEGMDKVREVIEKNRKRKLVKHKKLSNNRIIEIDNCSPLEIRKLQNNLTMIADNEGIEFVYGKGKRKTSIQRWYDLFLGYYIKLNEYEYWLDIIGERNSCSKTDHDATMCATKMDYYCNTGLSRPCYNAQIAVSDGVIVNAELYQRPADSKTFIPFMERYHEYMGEYPIYPMADAGYGSFENYMYCTDKKWN